MTDMWDAVSEAWERNAAFVDEQMATATAVMLDAAQVGAGAAVLDLACGPGGAGMAALERVGETGSLVLADDAPGMLRAAERRSAALGHVSTLLSDQLSIDAPDAGFDVVLCRHGLMFADVPADAVREAARVLRPGGHYAAMTWDARAANPWLGLIFDAVGAQFGAPFPPAGIAGPFALADPAGLGDVLRDGGLDDVQVARVATPLRAASLEDWWERSVELAGPLAIALAGMDEAVREEIRARALELGGPVARPAGDGVEMDGAVLVASGRRPA